MHEAAFTEKIVSAIIAELKKNPAEKFAKVKVSVGEMFHLKKDCVLFHYDLLTKGTELEGINIDLEEIAVQVKCRQCQRVGGVDDHHLLMCSYCDSREVDIVSGNAISTEIIEQNKEFS